MNKNQFRQGDLLIERIGKIPGATNKQQVVEDGILAHGEVTGHMHKLKSSSGSATLLKDDAGQMYISATDEFSVVHDEHAEIRLDPGTYQVIRQREYDQDAINEERLAAD